MSILSNIRNEFIATVFILILQQSIAYIQPFATRRASTQLAPSSLSKHRTISNTKLLHITPSDPTFSNSLLRRSKEVTPLAPLEFGGLENEAVQSLLASIFEFHGKVPMWQAFGLNAILFASLSSKLNKMLTPEGLAHSMALGTLLWATLGWRGWTTCVMYLFLGQLVTKVKFAEKEKKGIAEGRGGRRGPENVWGSALTALVCAACSVQGDVFLGISSKLYVLGFVAALATKLADTFASEIGKAYGKTTFLITTLERVEPGTEGAVSLEGTVAAAVGGSLLPLYGLLIQLIDVRGVGVATLAAFIACNFESFLGATLQEKKGLEWMTNEVVNFINTVFGAVTAMIGARMLLGMA